MNPKKKGLDYGNKESKPKKITKITKNGQCKTAGTYDADQRNPALKK